MYLLFLVISFISAAFTLFSLYKFHVRISNEDKNIKGFLHVLFVTLSLVLLVVSLSMLASVIRLLLINTAAGNGLGLVFIIIIGLPILGIGLLILTGMVGNSDSAKFMCQRCGVSCGLNWGDAYMVLCESCSSPTLKQDD